MSHLILHITVYIIWYFNHFTCNIEISWIQRRLVFSFLVTQKGTHSSSLIRTVPTPRMCQRTHEVILALGVWSTWPDRGCFVYGRRHPANLVTPVYSSVMQMSVTIAFLRWRPSLPPAWRVDKREEKNRTAGTSVTGFRWCGNPWKNKMRNKINK